MATPLSPDRALAALKAEGLRVVELPGWKTHNRNRQGAWGPVHGIMVHYTAGKPAFSQERAYAQNILYSGYAELPGPLCQFGVGTDGTVYMTGWGRCNHAGKINARMLDKVIGGSMSLDQTEYPGGDEIDGNSRLYGIENINDGEITQAQYDASVRICAALSKAHGWSGRDVLSHGEGTRRKTNDPPRTNMGQFRRAVMARVAAETTTPTKQQEPPVMEVTGRIGDRWRELGGANSPLGNPVGPEVATPRGAYRMFANGAMIWSLDTDARPNYGPIRDHFGVYGYEYGALGFPITDIHGARNGGSWQGFERGSIYYHPDTGAHTVYGAIGRVWAAQGHENGGLGYPTSDEFEGSIPGRVQRFQGGTAYWSLRYGAYVVKGLVLEQYARDGWEGGKWGYPSGPEIYIQNGWEQEFENGTMRIPNGQVVLGVSASAPGPVKVASPVPGSWISAVFGQKPKNKTYWQAKGFHTGRDYAANEGAPVLAVTDGYVTIREDAVLGHISILHGDNGRKYWYCHLLKGSRSPWNGERVKAGQQIAKVGQSGTGASGGPHLHLESSTSATVWGVGLQDPTW